MTERRSAGSCRAGIGLRSPHLSEIAATPPELGFLEVHAENTPHRTGSSSCGATIGEPARRRPCPWDALRSLTAVVSAASRC
jgi:uncharacterized protein (UPF0276 family)